MCTNISQHRYIYGAVSGKPGECGPAQGIVRVDTVTRELSRYYCATDSFLSEAIVAPKSSASNADEDDAYLVCLEHHPMVNSCDLLVFEASNISAGPLSRIDLKGPLPYSLHGSFSTTSFGFE